MTALSEYKFISPKLDGEILFSYKDGILHSIAFNLKTPLTEPQKAWFCDNILDYAFTEAEITAHGGSTSTSNLIKIVKPEPNNKAKLFYEYYSRHVKDKDGKSIEYKKGKLDHLVLRTYDVTPELLTVYFTSNNILFKNKYSINNFVKFYNQLRAEAAGAYSKSNHPKYWDAEHAKKLGVKELQEYWQVLRNNGWKYIDGAWREQPK